MPPPPPPPPGPPPPPAAPAVKSNARGPAKSAGAKKSGGNTDRGALLSQIHKGAALKKTVTNDRSAPVLGGNKPSPGGGRGPSPMMPPGGANKFNTVACHNNRPNSRELPNAWRGSQDDGVAKNNMINQQRKQSLTGSQTVKKQALKSSYSDSGGTPTPPVAGGLGGLFAGGVPRLPSANKRQQGPRGPGPALRPSGPRMANGPASSGPMTNGPGRSGPPPPPPSNTKPSLGPRPSSIQNGQNTAGRPGPPPPPPPSSNKPSVGQGFPPPPPAANKTNFSSNQDRLSSADRNGYMSGSNTSLNSNSSRLSSCGDTNSIDFNSRPKSGVTGGMPRSQPPPPPNRQPPGQGPPPPPPQSAKGGGFPPPPPPQSSKGPSSRPPSMVGRPLPPPPSQGPPPPPPPSNKPPPPPSTAKPLGSRPPPRTSQPPPPPPPSNPPSIRHGAPPPPPARTTSAQSAGGTLPRVPGSRPPPPPMRGPSTGATTNSNPPPPPPQRRSGNYSGGSDDFENRFRFHNANELPPPEPFSHVNKTYPSKNPRNPGKNPGTRAPPPPPPK